jgi:hypothetical protein
MRRPFNEQACEIDKHGRQTKPEEELRKMESGRRRLEPYKEEVAMVRLPGQGMVLGWKPFAQSL